MTLPSIFDITRQYLYGKNETPDGFFTNAVLTRGPVNEVLVSLSDIFDSETGPGRFANAASSPLVEFFFGNAGLYWQLGVYNDLMNGAGEIILTKAEAIAAFGLEDTDNGIYVDNKDFIDGADDYAERVYIWGTMAFKLSDDVVFRISAEGTFTIENFSLGMRNSNEDFDWQGGSLAGNYGSAFGLRPGIDPSDLADSEGGRALVINYGGDFAGQFDASYSSGDFQADLARYGVEHDTSYGQLVEAMQSVIDQLYAAGVSATLYQNKAVLFGTNGGNESISGTVSAAGYDITDTGTFLLFGSVSLPFAERAGDGIVYITGGGADTVSGTSKDDLILDGAGADTYDGRGGFDFISYGESDGAVMIDLAAGTAAGGTAAGDTLTKIEAVLGSASGDTFVASGNQVEILAGGAGGDLFEITIGGGSPTIVWGGEGADIIKLDSNGSGQAAGILVVQAENLTEETFHLLDLDALGLGNDFDWSKIDLVVLNPDAGDKVFLDDTLIESHSQSVPIYANKANEEGPNWLDPSDWDPISMGSIEIEGVWGGQSASFGYPGAINYGVGIVREFDIPYNFLNYSGSIVAPTSPFYFYLQEYRAPGLGTWITANYPEGGEIDVPVDPIPLVIGPYTIGMSTDYDLSGASAASEWRDDWSGYVYEEYRYHFYYWEDTSPWDVSPEGRVPWFIVGGNLEGSALVPAAGGGEQLRTSAEILASFGEGAITVTLPPPGTPGSGVPRGGSFGTAGAVSNLTGAEGTQRITRFDAVHDTVVLNGVALDGTNLPAGTTVAEIAGSVVIDYANDESHVVLRGLSLADWLAGAQAQIQGTSASETLTGTAGADVIAGGSGNDTVSAGLGNDRINYASGDTVILGNAANRGHDTLDLRRFTASEVRFSVVGLDVMLTTADGTIRLGSQVRYDIANLRSNLEAILFSDATLTEADIRSRAISDQSTDQSDTVQGTIFADFIAAGTGDDTILASGGNDVLFGGAGKDSLNGGAGADTMLGQSGDDLYVVDAVTDLILEQGDEGTDGVFSSVSWTLGDDVENLTLTGAGSNAGTGNSLANKLTGNALANALAGLGGDDTLAGAAGNDTLSGGAGNDVINGGTGADEMSGGAGNDTYLSDAEGDSVDEAEGQGIDLVQSNLSWTLVENVENLTLTGTAATTGTGNALNNVLTGNAAANSLSGLEGADTLNGGNGNDSLDGGAGNDRLDGGAGSDFLQGGDGDDTYVVGALADVVDEAASGGFDLVQSSVTFALAEHVETLVLTGSSAISGTGNAQSNLVTGNAAVNRLFGLTGDDTLVGGGGNDILTGGLGADQFVFANISGGLDTVTDFNGLNGGLSAGDVLRFDGLLVGSFVYLGAGSYSGGSDNSEARVAGNKVLLDADGDGSADITIALTGLSSAAQLSAADFQFV